MSLEKVEQAKRNAILAKSRLDGTLVAVQERVRPGNLATEAWDGVREKSGDLADGALQAVKKRPATVSVALGALALFLARDPLKRAVTRLIAGEKEDDGAVTTVIDTDNRKFNAAAPIVDATVREGVS